MKVNLAAQAISSSVANAIEFCCKDLKLIQFQGRYISHLQDSSHRLLHKTRRKTGFFGFLMAIKSFKQVKIFCKVIFISENCVFMKKLNIFFLKDFQKRKLRRKWIQVMRRDGFTPSKQSKLCGKHFTIDCYEGSPWSSQKKLKSDAIPSILDFPTRLKKSTYSRKPPKNRLSIISNNITNDSIQNNNVDNYIINVNNNITNDSIQNNNVDNYIINVNNNITNDSIQNNNIDNYIIDVNNNITNDSIQ
ncbi:uncharacterized protein DDB_G0288805-like [Hydra vulgaris]|uniref:uncharacterized protein DDB_G0288805-like n=1 Tax=Hydra vulgaris TaxID=6087 RepID=UPI0032EA34D8